MTTIEAPIDRIIQIIVKIKTVLSDRGNESVDLARPKIFRRGYRLEESSFVKTFEGKYS